jgi:plastocyanin
MRVFGRLRRVRYIAHALLLVGLLWLIVGASATSTAAADMQITIQNFAFAPATISVPVGTKVTWTNMDSATHTVTSDTGAFDSKNLANGASFSFTFTQAGTYAYHCAIHARMVASIVVTAGTAPTTAGAPSNTATSTTSVLPQTGAAQNTRNWGLIAALIAATVAISGGAVLRARMGKRAQE